MVINGVHLQLSGIAKGVLTMQTSVGLVHGIDAMMN